MTDNIQLTTMTEFSAADNHTVQISDRRWRLLFENKPMAEGTPRGFRYGQRFGNSRQLGADGLLPREAIVQVVLGWQAADEAWHLGLTLNNELASERGSRWCELVSWPDPDMVVFKELAQQTGEELSQVMQVPFYVIPPQEAVPQAPPRDLPDLPISFGLWSIQHADNTDKARLLLVRSEKWMRRKVGRIAWYAFWSVVYLALSIATLTAPIALPNAGTLLPDPQWLPYLGIGTFFFLWGLIFYQIWLIIRKPDRIIIDGTLGRILGFKGKEKRWDVDAQDIQSVYISEIIKRREKSPATEYGELNLHLGNGNYRFVITQHDAEDNDTTPQPDEKNIVNGEGIYDLNRATYRTNLQAAGVMIAEALERPAWLDLRVK